MIPNKVAKEGLLEMTVRKPAGRKEISSESRAAEESRGAIRLLRGREQIRKGPAGSEGLGFYFWVRWGTIGGF